MNLSGKLAASLAMMLLFATTAQADDRYQIDATLLHDGEVFAKPALIVKGGEPATIEVAGAEAFKLALTATRVDAQRVRVDADLESVHGLMQPTMIVRTGEPASVNVGDLRLDLSVAMPGATDTP